MQKPFRTQHQTIRDDFRTSEATNTKILTKGLRPNPKPKTPKTKLQTKGIQLKPKNGPCLSRSHGCLLQFASRAPEEYAAYTDNGSIVISFMCPPRPLWSLSVGCFGLDAPPPLSRSQAFESPLRLCVVLWHPTSSTRADVVASKGTPSPRALCPVLRSFAVSSGKSLMQKVRHIRCAPVKRLAGPPSPTRLWMRSVPRCTLARRRG